MMTSLPPFTEALPDSWPTRNQIKRIGNGIAMPGRSFPNVTLDDLPFLIGDMLTDASAPYDCVKLQIMQVATKGPQLTFSVFVEALLETEYPIHGFSANLFEMYMHSFCKTQGRVGVPMAMFFERTASFYEAIPQNLDGV